MKKLLVVFFILLHGISKSQVVFESEMQHSLILSVTSMLQLPGNDFLVLANARPATYDSSMALVIKTDSMMRVRWCKRLKVFHKDVLYCMTPLSDGNYLIGGSVREDFNTQSGGSVYKIDSAGSVLWHRQYRDTYDDHVLKIFERPDKSLVIFMRRGVFNTPTKIITADSTGMILSQRIFNSGINNLLMESAAADGNGNYYMAGNVNSSTGVFVLSVRDNTVNWYREFDAGRQINSAGMVWLSDNNFALTGNIVDSLVPASYNAIVVKCDTAGNIVWSKEVQQPLAYNDYGVNLLPLANAKMIVHGQANSVNGFTAFAARLDGSGDIDWSYTYGNYPYQSFGISALLNDGRILFSSGLSDRNYFVLTSDSGAAACHSYPTVFLSNDLWMNNNLVPVSVGNSSVTVVASAPVITSENLITAVQCSGTINIDEWKLSDDLVLTPNPSAGRLKLIIQSAKTNKVFLEIISSAGRKVLMQNIELSAGENTVYLDESYSMGVYLVRIVSGENVHTKRMVIQK